jgi:hypothetical protein
MGLADIEGARASFPLIDASAEELEHRMVVDPQIAYRILYDMVDIFRAADERKLGNRRTGRRVKVRIPKERMVAEVVGLGPSMDPFSVAIIALMDGRSQTQFAQLMGISQGQLSRLMGGTRQLDRQTLEMAAAAGRVPPWYFMEWRAMYVAEWVADLLGHHPNISMKILTQVPKPDFMAVL